MYIASIRADIVMALNPRNVYANEDSIAYLVSPWVDELSVQCLSVEYYNVGASLNTLGIYLLYEDEHLHVSLLLCHHAITLSPNR